MKALVLSALVALPRGLATQDKKPEAPKAQAPANPEQALIDFQKPCYPLKACAVCGKELDKKTVDVVVERHLVLVCSDACKAGVEAKKADIIKQLDAGVIAAQKAAYPLEKCPISGETLGPDAVDHVVGMRLVRTCCPKCVARVDASPDATFAKLEQAYIATQKAGYKVTVCPVTGKTLDDKAVDVLYGTTLVRMCSPDCKKTLMRAPHRVLNQLAALREGKPFKAHEGEDKQGREGHEGHGEKKNG